MAGEIPSFFDHIPITQNTINAIKLQELVKERIKYLNQWLKDNDKHSGDIHDLYKMQWSERQWLEHLVKESEKE